MEQHQGLTAEMYRAVVAVVDDRVGEIRVTREDYDRLVQAQERVEGRMERIEAALERLAQAQARTEERVGQLEEGQSALQQGQTALEEGQIALQQRQTALEEGQIALQQGQVALQAALERLVQAQARTEVAVGSLAESIGFGLEDVARLMLPPYLYKHHGIQLSGVAGEELQRRFFQVDDQPPVEIDLYGEGQRDGQQAVVLGEAKSRIGGGVVKDFADTLRSVEPLVEGEVWRVMFGYYIHPSAQPVAEEHRILLVASYQR
jgi:multidrug efflux pump subunit AcrA (membrane-fusion protein)